MSVLSLDEIVQVFDVQTFLLALPMGISSLSSTMHTSSIRRICSSSYPSRSPSRADVRCELARLLSTSGKRRTTLSAVMICVCVVVVLIVAGLFPYMGLKK